MHPCWSNRKHAWTLLSRWAMRAVSRLGWHLAWKPKAAPICMSGNAHTGICVHVELRPSSEGAGRAGLCFRSERNKCGPSSSDLCVFGRFCCKRNAAKSTHPKTHARRRLGRSKTNRPKGAPPGDASCCITSLGACTSVRTDLACCEKGCCVCGNSRRGSHALLGMAQ